MTWAILRHALGLLGRNLGVALRLSLGPLVLAALLGLATGQMAALGAGSPVPFGGATNLVSGLVSALLMAWLGVAWHRFVLLEEAPTGLLPPLEGPETLRAFGWSALWGLSVLILTLAAGPVLGPPLGALHGLLQGLGLGLPGAVAVSALPATGIAWLALRLGLVLPAAALGRPMDPAGSWAASAPLAWPLLAVAALAGLWSVLGPLAVLLLPAAAPPWAAAALTAALAWLRLMLGLAVLTTLYGHLVERRRLR